MDNLQVTIKTDNDEHGYLEARRVDPTYGVFGKPRRDQVSTYTILLVDRGITLTGSVEHKESDGAWALVLKALKATHR